MNSKQNRKAASKPGAERAPSSNRRAQGSRKKSIPDKRPKVDLWTNEGKRIIKVCQTQDEKKAYLRRLELLGLIKGGPPARFFRDGAALHLADLDMKMLAVGYHISGRPGVVKNHLLPVLGDVSLADLSPEFIRQFQQGIIEQKSPSLVKMIMRELRCVIRNLIAEGWLLPSENPLTTDLRAPSKESNRVRGRRKRQIVLSLPSLEQIVAMLEGDASDEEALLLHLGLYAGLRGQEIRALTWAHILFDDDASGRLDIRRAIKRGSGEIGDPKNGPGDRFVPFTGPLYDLLKRLAVGKSADDLVVSRNGKPLRTGQLYDTVHQYQVRLGIGETWRGKNSNLYYRGTYGPHLLRHACVALWIWAGIPDDLIRAWIGHDEANYKMTLDTYGYLFAAHDLGDEYWPPGPSPVSEQVENQILMECE